MTKILVTGGAGFIGSYTVRLLLEAKYKVTILDNFSSGDVTKLPLHPDLEIITGDVRNELDVAKAARNVNYIIHLAAQVSVPKSIADPKNSFENNLAGIVNILEYARQNESVEKVIFSSSAAIYGDNDNLPLKESEKSENLLSPYALEKKVSEDYINLYHKLYGLKFTILRYFNVFGKGQDPSSPYSGVISKFIHFFKHKENIKIYGDGKQSRDFIHVEDVARANKLALENGDNGTFNIASGKASNLLDIVEIFKEFAQDDLAIDFEAEREGDIKHSLANINNAQEALNFSAEHNINKIEELLR